MRSPDNESRPAIAEKRLIVPDFSPKLIGAREVLKSL